MVYFSQEMKKAIEPKIKEICKKYGIKARLGVRHHSTVVLNIKSGKIDFINNFNETRTTRFNAVSEYVRENYIDVNVYHFNSHFTGKAKDFLNEVYKIMNTGNHDNSNIQIDYFDVGFYVDINIGKWDTPYIFTK